MGSWEVGKGMYIKCVLYLVYISMVPYILCYIYIYSEWLYVFNFILI